MSLITWPIIMNGDAQVLNMKDDFHMDQSSISSFLLCPFVGFTQILGDFHLSFQSLLFYNSALRDIYLILLRFRCCAWPLLVKSSTMGGDRNRVETKSCDSVKLKKEVWNILEKGGLTPYMEKLHGNNPQVTDLVAQGWNERTLNLGGRKVVVDEDFITQITGLATHGMKVHSKTKKNRRLRCLSSSKGMRLSI